MSKALRVYLPEEERRQLEGMVRKGIRSARVMTRARILLLADRSGGKWRRYGQVAKALGCDPTTVSDICRRYAMGGLKVALYDKPRPGRAPKLTGEAEARLVLLACSQPPEGQKRWTLRLLAEQLVELGYVDSISTVAVYKRLKKMNSSPGR